jgi:hypothetical protein
MSRGLAAERRAYSSNEPSPLENFCRVLNAPMAAPQAQRLVFIGQKAPPSGWAKGRYSAEYVVLRSGRPILRRQFELQL